MAAASEAYFSALSKIGEKAFHSMSSSSLGDILIQICDSQRRLTLELEGVFRWFSSEVLQEMDSNVRLDRDYISGSRKQYEMEVHDQSAALQRQMRRGTSQDGGEYMMQFLRDSHGQALKEEERRYRFLAEKHCSLIQSISQLMNKNGGSLQQRADTWRAEVGSTRRAEAKKASPPDHRVGSREDIRTSREEMTLGNIPSRAPSPQGFLTRSAADSAGGGGGGGGRTMRAKVAHQPAASNPTLLPFNRGQMITVLVQQSRNGWLYGRSEGSSRQGWFPASYVENMEDPPQRSSSSSASTLRSSSSLNNPLDQAAPPPPPPAPQSEMPSAERRSESGNQNSHPHGSKPELFPRGTNPFATVKLKPTSTNDRSAPRLNYR